MPLRGAAAAAAPLTTWNIPPAAKLGVYEVVARARATAEARRGRRRGARAAQLDAAATSASRSSACRWSMRACQRAEGACRSRRRASPSTCR